MSLSGDFHAKKMPPNPDGGRTRDAKLPKQPHHVQKAKSRSGEQRTPVINDAAGVPETSFSTMSVFPHNWAMQGFAGGFVAQALLVTLQKSCSAACRTLQGAAFGCVLNVPCWRSRILKVSPYCTQAADSRKSKFSLWGADLVR